MIVDNTKAFIREFKVRSSQGLDAARLHLQSKMKQKLSTSANRGRAASHEPSRSIITDEKGKQRNRTVTGTRAFEASRPGEPPRSRTGTLRQSVSSQADKKALIARVGVPRNTIYGFYLEVGTRFIKPRPWMIATFDEESRIIARLLASEWS